MKTEKQIAGAMFDAALSDLINKKGPTKTDYSKMVKDLDIVIAHIAPHVGKLYVDKLYRIRCELSALEEK